ncbi:MAG: S1 RNA-binding domain-containing protein, partial [Candidatus Sumerlaeota bacterium]
VEAEKQFPKGSRVKGEVTGLTSFGAFVKLAENIEGLIHVSDFSWTEHVKDPAEQLNVGDEVEAVVLKTDRESRRISLGIKQLTDSPMKQFLKDHPVGSAIEGTVARMIPIGAFLTLVPAEENGGRAIDGFMHVSQIDTEHVEKPEEALKEGEKVEVKITKVERGGERISLSRKALLEAEERKAIKEFKADPRESKGVMKLGELLQDIQIGESGQVEEVPEDQKVEMAEKKAEEQTEPVSAPVKEVTDEPAKAEDVTTEPEKPEQTEPAKAEDVTTEPAKPQTTEPAKTEELTTEPAESETSEPIKSEDATTEPAKPEAAEPAPAEEAKTEPKKPESAEPAKAEDITTEPAKEEDTPGSTEKEAE